MQDRPSAGTVHRATALDAYQRLEAAALWRDGPDAQRRDVIVSIGEATLTIADLRDRPLTHWSLAALRRANPGQTPAVYHPDGDPGETLEIASDEGEMIAALEKLRSAIARRAPSRGRLRGGIVGMMVTGILAGAILWLPGALQEHALEVLPRAKRTEIGRAVLAETLKMSGPECAQAASRPSLDRLAARTALNGRVPQLVVVRDAPFDTRHLPGALVVLKASVLENHEEPEIVAGYVVAEEVRARQEDPMLPVLEEAGVLGVIRLLTTGDLPEGVAARYARRLWAAPDTPITDGALIDGFREAKLRSSPYAYAIDESGEKTIGLIEADPYPAGSPEPVLRDADWLRLQSICTN